jgi:hypothetical protein
VQGTEAITVLRTERVTINYDMDKLKEKLDKDIYEEIADKTYYVSNMDKLLKLIKSAGISAREFKSCIGVVVQPKRSEIKSLYDSGYITKDNLKGCFTAKISKNIQLKKKEV